MGSPVGLPDGTGRRQPGREPATATAVDDASKLVTPKAARTSRHPRQPGQPGADQELSAADDLRQGRDDALRRAVRLEVVQELADEMAHDLNNVLTVIAGSLQLFLMQQGGETTEHHFVRNAIEASLRGAQLTSNLLAYVHPQVVENRVFNLMACVQALAPVLRETLGSALSLQIITPPPLASAATNPGPPAFDVFADARFLESALLALCQGAETSIPAPLPAVPGGTNDGDRGSVIISFAALSAREARSRSGAIAPDRDYVLMRVRVDVRSASANDGSGGDAAPVPLVEHIRAALTPAFHTRLSGRPSIDLSAAYASIRGSGGDLSLEPPQPNATGGAASSFTVAFLLPATTR
jgi:hypothetical protein